MTSKIDLVKTFIDESWQNPPSSNLKAGNAYLSDTFKSIDGNGNVIMDKATYLGMGQMLIAAFKGFKWVLKDLREVDDGVIMTGHFEGTHTGDLDLSAMGIGVIPASGKKIVWPEAMVKWEVKDNKIISEKSVKESGGVAEFLAPLGVKMPQV